MTSYQTSAIASSDDDDNDDKNGAATIANSIGIIITSSTPLESTTLAQSLEIANHPLLDRSLWSVPIIHARCHVTSTPREYDPDSLHNLYCTATDLVDRGAVVIVTDIGFSSMQRDLAARMNVPVVCSAMIQLSALNLITANGAVGVITLDRQFLSAWNLVAVGALPDTPVIGLPTTSIWRQNNNNRSTNSFGGGDDNNNGAGKFLEDLVVASKELIKHHSLSVIVLEDPKFAVYTAQLQARISGVRFFDIVTGVLWLYAGHKRLRMSARAKSSRSAAMAIPGAAMSTPRVSGQRNHDEDDGEKEDASSDSSVESTTFVPTRQVTPQFREEVESRF